MEERLIKKQIKIKTIGNNYIEFINRLIFGEKRKRAGSHRMTM